MKVNTGKQQSKFRTGWIGYLLYYINKYSTSITNKVNNNVLLRMTHDEMLNYMCTWIKDTGDLYVISFLLCGLNFIQTLC